MTRRLGARRRSARAPRPPRRAARAAPPEALHGARSTELAEVAGREPADPRSRSTPDVGGRGGRRLDRHPGGQDGPRPGRDRARARDSTCGRAIKGQDHALGGRPRASAPPSAGLGNPKQPDGRVPLVGPRGVGKTETALALADLLYGGERFLTTINMSEFQEKHTVSRLIGSPPGYVGYGEGGVLTEAVRQRPYSVVLLDEVEKADPEVMNLFYQVFDKGMLTDGEGRVIDFKNTVIILTSNLASDVIMEMYGRRAPRPRSSSRRSGRACASTSSRRCWRA